MIKDKMDMILEHANITRNEYARRRGVDKSTVSRQFNRNTWKIQSILQLAEMCNCELVFIDKDSKEHIATMDISDIEETTKQ